ncbi:3-hydroxyacyl-CoA dehydrogenase NAD-binding domain-containing protein [Oceanicella sp. SM1341]|uniref:3-hydroxyacyl-CoA dehydrogenase NAD-binding domain-containing protein n=1 Tax=Oceanicella sp. SM1341 TaxID=1548889 RepID=UPI000E52C8B8|nr:3-hydroxyacyl-CoA dehydrogenase NAD-binding domain-containing protein [Oceanicella sp. SM1341]
MTLLRTEIRDGIAVLTAENPPVNALSHPLRAALAEAIAALPGAGVRAAVLTCAGRGFFAGADIREFGAAPQPPAIHALAAALEALPLPVVAAIHGAALGGGLELALGCAGRVAAAGAELGFPEVTLGLIPGSGGVVRSARALAPEEAARLVSLGTRIGAEEAQRLGLVDRVARGDLLAQARALASELAESPRPPLSARPLPPAPAPELWQSARAAAAKVHRGVEAPDVALDVLAACWGTDFETARAAERAAFERLRGSAQSAALRHVFFAERTAAKAARASGGPEIARPGVLGGGTMGAGIAAALLMAGYPVTLAEATPEAAAAARARLEGLIAAAAKRGKLDAGEALSRLTVGEGAPALAACDLVIEAVFEEIGVKRAVFAALEAACAPEALLVTNTSYLDPREIAAGLARPERFAGLHFFSPAQVMKLVELVPVPQTAPGTEAALWRLIGRLGKTGVRAGICDGFIGNRILRRYRAAAEALVTAGATPAAVDGAMRGFGFAMGPFEAQDMGGLDIAHAQRQAARAAGAPVPRCLGDVLVEAGRLGRKTGGGWYDYPEGSRAPVPSKAAARLIAPLCRPGTVPGAEEIAARLVGEMAAEGRAILDEGVAAAPQDIDLVEILGYGFPRWRGGPMFCTRAGAPALARAG